MPDTESDLIPPFPASKPSKGPRMPREDPTLATKGKKKTKSVGRKRSLKKELTDLFAALGTAVFMVNSYDGERILDRAEALAGELNDIAQRNDRLYSTLEHMLTAGMYSGLIMVAASVAVPIAANHGLVDRRLAPLFNAPLPPEREVEPTTAEGEHAGPEGTPGEAVILPAETPDMEAPWIGPNGEQSATDDAVVRPTG